MNIDQITAQLVAKLGASKAAALAPVVAQYGPALAAMAEADVWAWLNLAIAGDQSAAYAAILAKMPNADLASEWGKLDTAWQAANTTNAARVAWQRDALSAVLRAMVTIAASMVIL